MAESSLSSTLGRLVRRHDRDRFLTALFAPADRRRDLLALYGFNYEVAKTRDVVTEAALGEIRLQWWRDGIAAIYTGSSPHHHEVMEPLAAAIRARNLSRAHFDGLIDARRFDLGGEPPASLAALEAYVEASSARLVWLALEVLDERGATAAAVGGAVGLAYGLAGLLRAVPFHALAKRLYLPQELCIEAGLRVERELFELRSTSGLRAVVAKVAAAASRHLDEARAMQPTLSRRALPALLPAVLASADLARLRRAGYDPFAPLVAASDPWRGWRLSLAALTGRF